MTGFQSAVPPRLPGRSGAVGLRVDGNFLAMQISYCKLVRDRIREIIQSDDHKAVTRVLAMTGSSSNMLNSPANLEETERQSLT